MYLILGALMKLSKKLLVITCLTTFSVIDVKASSCLAFYASLKNTHGIVTLTSNYTIIKSKIADIIRFRKLGGFQVSKLMELAAKDMNFSEMTGEQIVAKLDEKSPPVIYPKTGELLKLNLDPYIRKAKQELSSDELTSSDRISKDKAYIYDNGANDQYPALKAEIKDLISNVLSHNSNQKNIDIQSIVTTYYMIDGMLNRIGLSEVAEKQPTLISNLALNSLVKNKSAKAVVNEFNENLESMNKLFSGQLSGLTRDTWFFSDSISVKDIFKVMTESNEPSFGIKDAINLINKTEIALNTVKNNTQQITEVSSMHLWSLPSIVRFAEIAAKYKIEPEEIIAKMLPYLDLIYPGGNYSRRLGTQRGAENILANALINGVSKAQ